MYSGMGIFIAVGMHARYNKLELKRIFAEEDLNE